MFDVLLQIHNRCIYLYLVFPVILSPLLLELKFRAVGGHESVDEVNLYLVDVNHMGNVAAGRIKT